MFAEEGVVEGCHLGDCVSLFWCEGGEGGKYNSYFHNRVMTYFLGTGNHDDRMVESPGLEFCI